MKLMLAALVVTFAIAVTAAVFAIWPVVADAPWEDEVVVVEQDQGDLLLCEAAIELRDDLRRQIAALSPGARFVGDQEGLLEEARRDVERYC